ncbi:NEP1-interacting protein-like 2 isoform X1 [Coffea arabica]|uniref:NEP1-interacting protein-like 2 isoform X1 n=1 Tax=Coffea arabica TaxID=13443 RepID=A0A6P6X4A1_COFAR
MALGHDEIWPSSSHGQACLSSGHARSRSRRKKDTGLMIAFCYLVRLMATAIFTALSILFAVAGAFTGGVAGGIAGWVSNTGILRGVAMVAIAGATISVQFLDALRTYWCSECPGSSSSSSMANFLQELFDTIFVNQQIEQLPPATPRSHQLQQVNRPNTSYGESRAGPSVVASSGLSEDSLKKLPCLVLLDEMKAEQEACCSICLQDVGVGDTARTLPQCRHMFHLACVDKWLVIHGSCPVCRQDVTNYP